MPKIKRRRFGLAVFAVGEFRIWLVLLFSFWRLAKWVDSTIDTCPFCRGSGKQWDSVHDSHDLQTVNCEYCQGTGKKPKKA